MQFKMQNKFISYVVEKWQSPAPSLPVLVSFFQNTSTILSWSVDIHLHESKQHAAQPLLVSTVSGIIYRSIAMEVEDLAHFPPHAPIIPARPSHSLILHIYLYPTFGLTLLLLCKHYSQLCHVVNQDFFLFPAQFLIIILCCYFLSFL